MAFIERYKQRDDLSFKGMRDTAMSLLPQDQSMRNKLYQDLERGKAVLDDEDHLNMFLFSFGKMHKAKLDAAFNSIPIYPIFFPKKLRYMTVDVDKERLPFACYTFLKASRSHLILPNSIWLTHLLLLS